METILTGILNLEKAIEDDKKLYEFCLESATRCIKLRDIDMANKALETLESVTFRIKGYKNHFNKYGIECKSYNQLLEHINNKRQVVLKAKSIIEESKK